MKCTPDRVPRGFTMIELVIVMAIVGILFAIAVPLYKEQLRKSARAEAQAFLTSVASRQQQYLVDKRRYATSLAALNLTAPAHVGSRFANPVTIEVADVVPPTFRIVASAVGDQAYDKCPTLVLDSAGNREPVGCW
jgi:type IV pilus assembly protein PilE